jgi:dTDP-4-dehydrorhamnose reductase
MFKKKLWLILGGSGQLGQSLKNDLESREIEFIAPTSSRLDICNFELTRNFILNYHPHVVVNCAAWTNVAQAEINTREANDLNGYAVNNLIKTCDEIACTFVQISTDYVFSGSKMSPYLVNDETDPINAYGISKLIGEKLIKEAAAEKFYIFRTAWLYSEYGTNFVKTIIRKHNYGNNQIKVVKDQFGNPTYASDLASQIIQSINHRIPYGIYHAVNSGTTSWYDFAVRIIDYSGFNSDIVKGVDSRDLPSGVIRPSNTSLDTTNWSDLGISSMRSWEDALKSATPKIIQSL